MKRPTIIIAIAMALLALPMGRTAGAEPFRIGKNAGEIQGRWLELADPDGFTSYATAYIGEVRTDIAYQDRQKAAVDGEELSSNMRQRFFKRLVKAKLFDVVLGNPVPEGEPNALRLDFDLVVDPGSRAARFAVGLGAGKSKSVLEILMKDHETGELVGKYHGYGSGSGIAIKPGGGSATKMTKDDIEEHSAKFVELLKKVR